VITIDGIPVNTCTEEMLVANQLMGQQPGLSLPEISLPILELQKSSWRPNPTFRAINDRRSISEGFDHTHLHDDLRDGEKPSTASFNRHSAGCSQ
jgi:hypothetical protein